MHRCAWQPVLLAVRLSTAGVALAAFSGCVQIANAPMPPEWPALERATPERLQGTFTGEPIALARSVGVFFNAHEIYGPNLRRKAAELTFEPRGDSLVVRATFNDSTSIEGHLAGAFKSDAFVIERCTSGREGPNMASYRDVWRLRPDANGGLVFEHIHKSVGLMWPVPGAYYGRTWWRLAPVVADPVKSLVAPSSSAPESQANIAPRTATPPAYL